MLRRLIAMLMVVGFIAMATSGLLMFLIEKPSFTLQMHPVHKVFGVLFVLSACGHMYLNRRAIKAHLVQRSGLIAVTVLTLLLVAMYGVAMNNALPPEQAKRLDAAAAHAEQPKAQRP